MFLPDLFSRDAHNLWRSPNLATKNGNESTRQQKAIQRNSVDSNTPYAAPPLSSYSACFTGPIFFKDKIDKNQLYFKPVNDSMQNAFDDMTCDIASRLHYLNHMSGIGYDYLHPIGINKTLRQTQEEKNIDDYGNSFNGEELEEADNDDSLISNRGEDFNGLANSTVANDQSRNSSSTVRRNQAENESWINASEELTGDRVVYPQGDTDPEVDLDQEIPDEDNLNLNYSGSASGYESAEEEGYNMQNFNRRAMLDEMDRRINASHDGIGEYDAGDDILEVDEGFMVSEEYQPDHSIAYDAPPPGSIDANLEPVSAPVSNQRTVTIQSSGIVSGDLNTGSTAIDLNNSISSSNSFFSRSRNFSTSSTNVTSPTSVSHIEQQQNQISGVSGLRISSTSSRLPEESDDSNYDMTIEE
ncbi:hypothetical protein B5S32_g3571 [[Candida] boidinii]|nr:hypothetical protein B5S32_g3571 [[Candida] boidinii]